MPCYHPNIAYRGNSLTTTGKQSIVFDRSKSASGVSIQLPCGQCIGCRLEYSRQWAVRCHHEGKLHSSNCFITLTYNDKNLAWDHSLNVKDFQVFMKAFRHSFRIRKINPTTGRLKQYYTKRIRFFHSGEYGKPTPENNFIARPHHHAIIFNHQFDDRKLFASEEGINLYTSDLLDSLWGLGYCTVGDLTFESAAYCARYITKKVNASAASPDEYFHRYHRTDHITGELIELKPEHATMSRRPGIGSEWFKQYKSDCFPSDTISIRGTQQRPPKYYDILLEAEYKGELEAIKEKRISNAKKHWRDQTPERLATREQVKLAKIKNLQRSL